MIEARAKRSQHVNTTYSNMVGRNTVYTSPAFGCPVVTCWVLLPQVLRWLNLSQKHIATWHNRADKHLQHVATYSDCLAGALREVTMKLTEALFNKQIICHSIGWHFLFHQFPVS